MQRSATSKGIATIIRCLIFLLLASAVSATDITELIRTAKHQPDIQDSELAVTESGLQEDLAYAALFPKIDGVARYEKYNSPTNLRPLPPTEVTFRDPIPFSNDIFRYGVTFQMPVYVQPVYTLAGKMKLLKEKAGFQKQIDVVKKEAAIVSLNSTMTYLDGVQKAILSRKASLAETISSLTIKVDTGRTAEAELMKVQKLMADLERQENDISQKQLEITRDIYKLTQIDIHAPLPMTLKTALVQDRFIAIQAIEKEVAAAEKDVQRARELFYPSIYLEGFLSENEGTAYNTDSHIDRTYNGISLILKIPFFEKSTYISKEIAHIRLKRSQKGLEKTRIELEALAGYLNQRLPLIETAIRLAESSVGQSEELLKIAAVAYRTERITTEEYLRYEADVLQAQSETHRSLNDRWQVIAQQAVLYVNDLEGEIQ